MFFQQEVKQQFIYLVHLSLESLELELVSLLIISFHSCVQEADRKLTQPETVMDAHAALWAQNKEAQESPKRLLQCTHPISIFDRNE